MTIPGLALFYGGLVRTKNVLSVLMQCFALTAIMTLVWVIIGYSLAFNTDGMEAGLTNINSFIGGLGTMFLSGVTASSLSGTIPETVWITFQMTFAIITPALIVGAFAERMKFSAMILFSILWSMVVYAPICHMAWSGDWWLFLATWACSTLLVARLYTSTRVSQHLSRVLSLANARAIPTRLWPLTA